LEDETIPAETVAEIKQVIYCGPSLPAKNGLRQYAVFLNGLPVHIVVLTEKCPAINALIVDVKNLSAIKKALAVSGSIEAVMYKIILETF